MTLIDAGVARFLSPILPVGLALLAASRGWGALNHLSVPFWPSVLIGVLLLDLVIYLQHVMFHTLPLFWRLHGMHHTDLDIDVTSGLRFHPLEIFLSTLIKLAAVAVLGVSALAVLVFEVLLNVTSMFNHGNIHLRGGGRSACSGCSSSPPICTVSTIRSSSARRTAISVSTFPGGIAYSARTDRNRRWDMTG